MLYIMKSKFTFLGIMVLFAIFDFDLTNAQTFTNYTVTSNSNTLASNFVNAIAIDAQGNKWFGTDHGVSKFDGSDWTNYTTSDGLASNNVNAIAIDAQGNKWIGTNGGGVSKFDGNTWTTYTTSDGLAGNVVDAIAIDTYGNKWFGSRDGDYGGGITKFDGSTWTTYKNPYFPLTHFVTDWVMAIGIDADGNKWTVNMDIHGSGHLSKFDGTTWTTYSAADGTVGNDVTSIAFDTHGNKWFGTANGVAEFDGTTWSHYTTADGLAGSIVNAIAIDGNGNKWFGTWGGGVAKFDGAIWTTYNTNDGLAGSVIWSIAIDTQGNEWFGTNNGVSKLSAEASTALKPVLNENHITLYPNPVQNILHINLSGTTGMLDVFESTGKSVLQKQINESNTSIDVAGLENGIYLVKVVSDKQMLTGKFVKQ